MKTSILFLFIFVSLMCSFGSPPQITSSQLLGDVNHNGVVNILDLQIISSYYKTATALADVNQDSIVNIFDLAIAVSNYGKKEATAIPTAPTDSPTDTPHPTDTPTDTPPPTDTPTDTPPPTDTPILDSDHDGVPVPDDKCNGAIPGATGLDLTGCPTNFDDPAVELTFEPGRHQKWYTHFWDGKCTGLSGWEWHGWHPQPICVTFEGYRSIINRKISDMPSETQGRVRNRLWALGRKVGFEWARNNDKRCIDDNFLRTDKNSMVKKLEQSNNNNLESTLNEIEIEVNKKLSLPQGRSCLSKPEW